MMISTLAIFHLKKHINTLILQNLNVLHFFLLNSHFQFTLFAEIYPDIMYFHALSLSDYTILLFSKKMCIN